MIWVFVAVLASLQGVVICRPPIVTRHGIFSTDPVSQEYRDFLDRNAKTGRSTYPPGFKFMYFSQAGSVSHGYRPPDGHYIKVVASPKSSNQTLAVATRTLMDMMRHTPEDIFNRMANSPSGAGVFTAEEKITVFPEFAVYKDTPECKGSCDGSCSITCTFDGRKVDTLAGGAAALALVLEDNLLCLKGEPYSNNYNVLVHEYGHLVDKNGLTEDEKAQNVANYDKAKSQALWDLSTYLMANSAEYFAESTGGFFLVNYYNRELTGQCSYGYCSTEKDARDVIKSRDIDLYNFLVHVWTNGNADQSSGLTICPA